MKKGNKKDKSCYVQTGDLTTKRVKWIEKVYKRFCDIVPKNSREIKRIRRTKRRKKERSNRPFTL